MLFFVHQHINDGKNDITNILTNITNFRNINTNDIKNTEYLLIDLDGTVINRLLSIQVSTEKGIEFLKKLHQELNELLRKHDQNCGFVRNVDLELNKNYFNLSYITDINETINKFKPSIPNMKVCTLSRSWPCKMLDNATYTQEAQFKKLGINVISNFLYRWNESSREYCKCCYDNNITIENQLCYFESKPEMISKNIVIVNNDINRLNYIYNAYKSKYPQHVDKLKLYLYNNRSIELNKESDWVDQLANKYEESNNDSKYPETILTKIEREYCNCQAINNKREIHNGNAKGEQNVTKTKHKDN